MLRPMSRLTSDASCGTSVVNPGTSGAQRDENTKETPERFAPGSLSCSRRAAPVDERESTGAQAISISRCRSHGQDATDEVELR